MPKIQFEEQIDSQSEFMAGFPARNEAGRSRLPKLPGNVIEWFEQPGYLFNSDILKAQRDPKTGLYLFPKAFIALRDFFDLLCPYCQDARKIDDTPAEDQDLKSQVLLRYGKCPQCEISIIDVQRAKRANNALEFVLALGMGSGKTALLGGAEAYVTACAATQPRVREAFGFAPGAPMEFAFVASTGQQAKKTIWAYYTAYLNGSPWWKRFRDSSELAEVDEEILDEGTTVWRFPKAGFECQSLHSNSGGLAGLRRLGAVIDELARFDMEGRRGANEVYQVLVGSMQNTWKAYDSLLDAGTIPPFKPFVGACSSPIHEGDKVMSLGAEAEKNPGSRIHFENEATWDWNPMFEMEDFAREFARDPRRAERDYGAKPMGMNERLLQPGVAERCVDLGHTNMVITKEDFIRDKLETPYVKVMLGSCPRDRSTPRFIHCDAGHVRDSFGTIVGHSERDELTGTFVVVIDAAIEVRPWSPPGQAIRYEILFDAVGDLLLDLVKLLLVAKGTFDQWQSVTQIQRLRGAGHDFSRVKLTEADWNNVRDLAESNRLVLPRPECDKFDRDDRRSPVRKLVYELTSLERRNGVIDHPADGSSDLAVGVCGIVKMALENAGMAIDAKGRGGRSAPPGWMPMSAMQGIPRHRRIGGAHKLRRW